MTLFNAGDKITKDNLETGQPTVGLLQQKCSFNPYFIEYLNNLLYVGFIPGLFSMLLGTALAGRGIFKRETARLFKELEV